MASLLKIILVGIAILCSSWGFFAHKKINQLAVFTLPPSMSVFYKKNIDYITEAAVNPDKRRYTIAEEGARHFIDLDDYGDSAIYKLPHYWTDAVMQFGEDSLQSRGIVPWHIYRVYLQLKEAFLIKDPDWILRASSDLGHYVSDAHVPLHTTKNYDGQLTDQIGIHGFWESRLPELYFEQYDFFVGKAKHIENVQLAAWQVVLKSNQAVDSVLQFERRLYELNGNEKFNFETKGKQTIKVVSESYARKYHEMLSGMVERQFRSSIKLTGDIWFTAWVDAGQPDLKTLINYRPSEKEIEQRKKEILQWKEKSVKARDHESIEN